jgi:hypothetical protein
MGRKRTFAPAPAPFRNHFPTAPRVCSIWVHETCRRITRTHPPHSDGGSYRHPDRSACTRSRAAGGGRQPRRARGCSGRRLDALCPSPLPVRCLRTPAGSATACHWYQTDANSPLMRLRARDAPVRRRLGRSLRNRARRSLPMPSTKKPIDGVTETITRDGKVDRGPATASMRACRSPFSTGSTSAATGRRSRVRPTCPPWRIGIVI